MKKIITFCIFACLSSFVKGDETYTYLYVQCITSQNVVKIKSEIGYVWIPLTKRGVMESSTIDDRKFIVAKKGICALDKETVVTIEQYSDKSSVSGQCGASPANYINIYLNGREILNSVVHAKCGGLIFRYAKVTASELYFCTHDEPNYDDLFYPDRPETGIKCETERLQ